MAKTPNNLPPFTPVDLRAWMEGNADERSLVGAIRLLQWIEGKDAELPLALILAAMPGTSPRQLKRTLASVKAKGWLVSKRTAKGRLGRGATTYLLAIDEMSFKDARHRINLEANLAPRSEGPTGQLELTKGPKSTDQGATVAPANNQEKDLQERPTRETPSAPKREPGKHPDQDAFWAEAKATWAAKHPGAELAWPARTMRDWQMHLTAELIRLGGPELGRRWKNCATDPWAKPSLRAFILDTDKWITARGPAGAAPGRAFNRPESDPERRPTGGTLE